MALLQEVYSIAGCAVMVGIPARDNVAASDSIEQLLLDATMRYWFWCNAVVALVMLSVAVVAPEYGALLVMFAHVPPLSVESCHCLEVTVPVVVALKVVLALGAMDRFMGCSVIPGIAYTVPVALLLPVLQHPPSVRLALR